MTRCYIGLGSNLGEPLANVSSALRQLAQADGVELKAVSRFFTSKPMGPQDQPDYVNAVAAIDTTLPAEDLLQVLFAIERTHGRIRDASLRWGPRTLDMDMLLYGDTCIDSHTLRISHPGLCERSFVVLPLMDIAPHLILPNSLALSACLATLACDDLTPLAA